MLKTTRTNGNQNIDRVNSHELVKEMTKLKVERKVRNVSLLSMTLIKVYKRDERMTRHSRGEVSYNIMHTHACACVYMRMHAHTYIYIYNTHTYTHTHTHTHTRTPTHAHNVSVFIFDNSRPMTKAGSDK